MKTQTSLLFLAIMLLIGSLFTAIIALPAAAATTAHFNRFQVVDLSAGATEDGQIIDVCGGIKNQSFSSVRGYAILYLIDKNNTVVHAIETEVNDQQLFHHGQTGTFNITVDISALHDLQSVTVEFVQQTATST
ncbi:MAG: hypothetical protein J7K75_04400 [Desulfuromonas sp.]|nr:hypothetical protein [Desulfuromonas sp.]